MKGCDVTQKGTVSRSLVSSTLDITTSIEVTWFLLTPSGQVTLYNI